MSIDILQTVYTAVVDPNLSPLPKPHATIKPIVNFIFGLAGALAVLFVVIGGLRYILSRGNPDGVSKAKDTIVYALVGLAIVITAYGIISFVLTNI
jgi:hypothetical protein